jgi:anti-sigma factor ChrR (cupin superfamily)
MIHQHLQRRAMVQPPVVMNVHLDEDALSAFVEGRLSETESAPVVQHLVACGSCRRATAELVRLEAEIGPATESTPATEQEPGRIRKLLDDLASRVLPHTEGDAVFAYHAQAEDAKRKTEAAEDQSGKKGEDEAAEKKPDSTEQ